MATRSLSGIWNRNMAIDYKKEEVLQLYTQTKLLKTQASGGVLDACFVILLVFINIRLLAVSPAPPDVWWIKAFWGSGSGSSSRRIWRRSPWAAGQCTCLMFRRKPRTRRAALARRSHASELDALASVWGRRCSSDSRQITRKTFFN